jgi:peptidoglycan/xylan/chitin deacetylase (PgdA/CDA1 family)
MTRPETLRGEVLALAEVAKRYAARHERIEGLAWPEGMRIAVNFTLDFDAMLLRRLANEPPMQLAKGEFGGRVGIWRLIELFDSHGIKATIFTPGRICELYPQALRAAVKSGHELADHMWEHRVPKEPELELDHLTKATEALTRIAGTRPIGSRSWHTPALLKRLGYIYNSHGSADHRPYWLRDGKGESCLLELPWSYGIDDAMYFNFAWLGSATNEQRLSDPDRVAEMWWDGFWHQYRAGGYFNIVLHPFVSGRALRIAMLDGLIARMKRLPGVWFPTCEEVARHCLVRHPPSRSG